MVSRSACPGGHQNTGRIFIAPKSIQIWFIIRFEPPPNFFKNYKAKCKHSMTLQICSYCCWALGCHLQNVQQKKKTQPMGVVQPTGRSNGGSNLPLFANHIPAIASPSQVKPRTLQVSEAGTVSHSDIPKQIIITNIHRLGRSR